MVWSDEFQGPAGAPANPENWANETGGDCWGNEDLQYYTDGADNAALDGAGHLVLTARPVDPGSAAPSCWYGPCSYTSARLVSAEKRILKYGRVEARIQVPAGRGIWPALWLFGSGSGNGCLAAGG